MGPKPSPIRELVTAAVGATDAIDIEMLISEFEMTHVVETRSDRNFDMGLIAARQHEDAAEIQRLEELLIGLGVDPHAKV